MESTLENPALVTAKTNPKARTIVYWIATALFCLQMGQPRVRLAARQPRVQHGQLLLLL